MPVGGDGSVKPIAELLEEFAPEKARIIAELGTDESDEQERRVQRYCTEYAWALYRVEHDFHDDSDDPHEPWNFDWLRAHREQWSDAAQLLPVRNFHDLCSEGRIIFHELHPEWQAEHDRKCASESGRLF